jgi:ankyrin repeat protein
MLKKIYQSLTVAIFLMLSVVAAHKIQQDVVPVKTQRSLLRRLCSAAGCCTTDAVSHDAYKVHRESYEVEKDGDKSGMIDIEILDLEFPQVIQSKADDVASLTDRSLTTQATFFDTQKYTTSHSQTMSSSRLAFGNFSPDINAYNRKKNRPLHQAIMDAHLKEVMRLVESGADVRLLNRRQDSVLHILIEYTDRYDDPSQQAAIFEFLVQHGAIVDAKNKLGQTPLHLAAEKLLPEIVQILVDGKANINAQDHQGRTPLMTVINRVMPVLKNVYQAVYVQQAEMIRLLIDLGANITIADRYHRLPVDDINYHIKSHGMLSSVADYLDRSRRLGRS